MPYSNYSKIRDMLLELDRLGGTPALGVLAESIRSQGVESFSVYRAPAPGAPPERSACSPDAVRRLVRLAADLGFVAIDEEGLCSLTRVGRSAVVPGSYDKVLSTHLALYLKERVGVTYTEIKEALGQIRPPEVPSFDTLYRHLAGRKEIKVPEDQFRTILYLLERCGMLTTQIRKIYFAPEVKI
jgi:hypothetical protein